MYWRMSLAGAAVLAPVLALLAAGPDEKAPKADSPPKMELHRLENKALLEQASGIYDKAAKDYLASLRGLAAAQALLEEAERRADEKPNEPEEKAKDQDQDKAKAAVEAAKAKATAARKRLALVQQRKMLLDRTAAANEAAETAAVAFLNALDDLKPYLIEVRLRVKDATLAAEKAPTELSAPWFQQQRKEIAADQQRRKTAAAEAQKAQAGVAKQLDDANKAALAADAEVTQAGKALAQEQKRQMLEKMYAGKGADVLLADLARLADEGDGLSGAYELALSRFHSQAAEVGKLRKAIDAAKPPEAKVPQIASEEDVEVAAKAIGQVIAFYSGRAKEIRTLRSALAALGKQGSEFEADAAVWSNHLFEMNVIGGMLKKSAVPEGKLPEGGRPKRLAAALERQGKSAAEVLAMAEKARGELAQLDKQLAEAEQAGGAAAKQLAGLTRSREATLAALKWDVQLRTKSADEVAALFAASHKELAGKLEAMKSAEAEYRKASSAVADARARLDGLKDPFLRQAEEQGQAERQKIVGELRKEAGLDRPTKETPMPPTPAPDAKKQEKVQKKAVAEKKPDPPDTRTPLEKSADTLGAFHQLLAARSGVLDERSAKSKELIAALEGMEKTAAAYVAALSEARQLTMRQSAAGSDLKKRVGKGQLQADKIPEGVTEALGGKLLAQLDADAGAAQAARAQAEQDRKALATPDPDGDALDAATKELLALVDGRLDLIGDLKKLAADVSRDRKDRPQSETLRISQLASERASDASTMTEWLLSVDGSTAARSLDELLLAYYRESVEIEEKDDIARKQKEKIDKLIEWTRTEPAAVGKVLQQLEAHAAKVRAAQEEALVLARARLKPEQADELLDAYRTKTGRLLPRPPPLNEKEKAEQVAQMAASLADGLVRLDAARRWSEVLAARQAPTGSKAEAGVYQDELVRVNAGTAANARRLAALTGSEDGDAKGGEIGRVRRDLYRVRRVGVQMIALKLALILVGAIVLPWLFGRILGRVKRRNRQEAGLVLAALKAIVKVVVWVGALALALSVLGFDVTAVLAGLGIGGLAVGLAAKSVISDVIAAGVIFAEHKFKVGDVIKIGNAEPARVVGLNWRSTQLRDHDGLSIVVPNQKVVSANVQNITRDGRTFDTMDVTVTTEESAEMVLELIRKAMQHEGITGQNVSIEELQGVGVETVVKYTLKWFLVDYSTRTHMRDELFRQVGKALTSEEMGDTRVVAQ